MFLSLWDLQDLLAARPFGPIAVAALSVSVLASLAFVVAALFARRSGVTKTTRVIMALTFGTFALGAFATSRVLAEAHASTLGVEPTLPSAKMGWAWGIAFGEIHAAWRVFGLALVPIAGFSGAAFALLARRAGALRPFAIAAALACALGVATGVGVSYHFHTTYLQLGLFCGTVEDRNKCIRDLQREGRDVSSIARVVILALATLGSGVLVAVSRRSAKDTVARDPEGILPIGAAVFAFGLAGWAGARGMAHDARHPLPLPADHDGYCSEWSHSAATSLPPAGHCDGSDDAPEVAIDAEGIQIDGGRVAEVAELLVILENKRKLFRELQQRDVVDPIVVISASADTPMARVLPILSVVQKDYRGHVAILGAHPERSVSTVTLGEIALRRRCCWSKLRMAPNGAPLSSHATWGDVARAASEGAFFRLEP
ncbi:hypothetical protein [Polyangium jinanense]|uniref:Uncharacterized protein n=1 Tax=Polyangium jinanense TaxID=2829994 RepID=A0A9X4AS21_9BACT|nr:hypothetical protein [Polyangium jinanense]MDC3953042.1 hypothetical protein [Polyangium jinanense]MDC3980660.1 hypothetical protein [Polyangium jinanense]